MLTVISGNRQDADSAGAENNFAYWQQVVASPKENNYFGDRYLLISSLSSTQTPLDDFRRSRIPVFVGYGTRDRSALLEDYLRLEMIRAGKTNFTFRAYPGLEHNFMGFTNGEIDQKKWNWDRVPATFSRGCAPSSAKLRLRATAISWSGISVASRPEPNGPRACFRATK